MMIRIEAVAHRPNARFSSRTGYQVVRYKLQEFSGLVDGIESWCTIGSYRTRDAAEAARDARSNVMEDDIRMRIRARWQRKAGRGIMAGPGR